MNGLTSWRFVSTQSRSPQIYVFELTKPMKAAVIKFNLQNPASEFLMVNNMMIQLIYIHFSPTDNSDHIVDFHLREIVFCVPINIVQGQTNIEQVASICIHLNSYSFTNSKLYVILSHRKSFVFRSNNLVRAEKTLKNTIES